jgi:hypothetical protein
MNPPALVPTQPVDLAPGLRAFEVVRAGVFDDILVERGEILLVRCDATGDGRVVLLPRGHGRPALGRREGNRLCGAWGEPCHRDRWEVAGRIVWRARHTGRTWRLDPLTAGRAAPAEQLPLFQAA